MTTVPAPWAIYANSRHGGASAFISLNLSPIFTLLEAPFLTQPFLQGNIRLSSHHLHQLVNNFVCLQFGAAKV